MLISVLCHQVAEAVCLEQLSYHEAWELSYFGANVLHPRTTLPAMKFRCAVAASNRGPQSASKAWTLARQHFHMAPCAVNWHEHVSILAGRVTAASKHKEDVWNLRALPEQCTLGCSIPITIRNFFKPEAPGTVIGDFVTAEDGSGGQFVKGFATIDNVALINVEVTALQRRQCWS